MLNLYITKTSLIQIQAAAPEVLASKAKLPTYKPQIIPRSQFDPKSGQHV